MNIFCRLFQFISHNSLKMLQMYDRDVTFHLKQRLNAAGLESFRFCCKSFRIGMVTTVLRNQGRFQKGYVGVFYDDAILRYLAFAGRWCNER